MAADRRETPFGHRSCRVLRTVSQRVGVRISSAKRVHTAETSVRYLTDWARVYGFRYNAKYTDLCAPVEIERIEWATKMAPNEGLLKFNQAADTDGFVPDMSANTKVTKVYLQLKVVTRPAYAVFEFSCQYDNHNNQYTINVSSILVKSYYDIVIL